MRMREILDDPEDNDGAIGVMMIYGLKRDALAACKRRGYRPEEIRLIEFTEPLEPAKARRRKP